MFSAPISPSPTIGTKDTLNCWHMLPHLFPNMLPQLFLNMLPHLFLNILDKHLVTAFTPRNFQKPSNNIVYYCPSKHLENRPCPQGSSSLFCSKTHQGQWNVCRMWNWQLWQSESCNGLWICFSKKWEVCSMGDSMRQQERTHIKTSKKALQNNWDFMWIFHKEASTPLMGILACICHMTRSQ